jgi:alpha/beta superfamily hydrolase
MIQKVFSVFFLVLLSFHIITAQEEAVEPERVEVMAVDDLVLVGDYYAAPDAEAPSVLLLHMLESNRRAWNPLIPPLLEAGYNVLAVDLRGHGETRGIRDWEAAQTDTQTWLTWMREQPNVADDQIAIIGASIGTILALNGCAADEQCLTAIALSPVSFRGLETDQAVSEGLSEKSVLLITGQRDDDSPEVTRQMLEISSGNIAAHFYNVGTHGTDMLNPRRVETSESIIKLILLWLEEQPSQQE